MRSLSRSAEDIDWLADMLRDMSDAYCLEYSEEEYADMKRLVVELRKRAKKHADRRALRGRLKGAKV